MGIFKMPISYFIQIIFNQKNFSNSYIVGTISHETAIHGHSLFFSSIAYLAISSIWFGLLMSRLVLSRLVLSRALLIAMWFQKMLRRMHARKATKNEFDIASTYNLNILSTQNMNNICKAIVAIVLTISRMSFLSIGFSIV